MRCSRAIALAALAAACSRGSTRLAPVPSGVQPSAAYTSTDVPVAIVGEHFEPRAVQQVRGGVQVDASFRAFLGSVELKDVRWQSTESLTATVPAGLAGGPFDLVVMGPTGEGVARSAFRASTLRPPVLKAALTVPARLELGTQARVDCVIGNDGDVPLESPAMRLVADPGLRVVSLPAAPARIAPGQTLRYAALVAAELRGPAQLALEVDARDGFTGSIQSARASVTVTVLTPPSLAGQRAVLPQTVSVGQAFDVAVDVTNSGDVDALQLTFAALQMSGPGAISSVAPPPQDVPAGATRTFHFAAQASSAGLVRLTATGAAADAMTGLPVPLQVSWNPLPVQVPAALAARWLRVPGSVASGQTFTAALAVTNTGEALARSVRAAPDPPEAVPATSASGASAQPAQDIPGGGTAVFQWTSFVASGTGASTFQLRAGASGADANSGAAVTAPAVTSPAIVVQNLSASLEVAPAILRGDRFTAVLRVANAGSAAVNGVTPSALSRTGTALVSCGAATPASADLPALSGSANFNWICTAVGAGSLQLSATVNGVEAGTGAARSASAAAGSGVVETLAVASNPLGDGTAIAYVVGFAGRLYVGPRASGAGAVRLQPDGSGGERVSFSLAADRTGFPNANQAPGPFPSLGAEGCTPNTLACGPDNEDGRGFFGMGTFSGVPWLLAGGSSNSGKVSHVYASSDTSASPAFSYVELHAFLSGTNRTTSFMTELQNVLLVSFGSTTAKPLLLALTAPPAAPGYAAVPGQTGYDLNAAGMPGVVNRVDAVSDFGGQLYAFNDGGGCARANGSSVLNPLILWTSCTPSASAYAAKGSTVTQKTAGLTPADRAFPQVVSWGGRLYAGRNTTSGPQLWSCAPALNGICSSGDWSLVAPNGIGDAQLTQFDDAGSTAIGLLVATSAHLYVGFDNPAGAAVFRSSVPAPASRADFERVGPPGLSVSATRIFDAKDLSFAGSDSIYAAVGDGVAPLRLVRLAP